MFRVCGMDVDSEDLTRSMMGRSYVMEPPTVIVEWESGTWVMGEKEGTVKGSKIGPDKKLNKLMKRLYKVLAICL